MYTRNYNLTPELRAQLEQLIPEAFQDGQLNIDTLKALIGEEDITDNSQEHFELSWVGKRKARKLAAQAPIGALVPQEGEGINEENTNNIFIEGENLEVLRLLRQAYKGKIKMIYIDPPYNTGNDFVYKDNFAENKAAYLDKTGENLVSNPKSQGRFHANWLNFMYPRLRIAKDLLKEDGVIFISIDDNEVHNLRQLMDEVFGAENFFSNIVWQKKYAAANDAKGFANTHDHIICYQKSSAFNRELLPRTEKQNSKYKYDSNDGKGRWRSDNLTVKTYSESYFYEIINPNTGKGYWPSKGRCWLTNQDKMQEWINEGRVFFGQKGDGAPQLKRYLNEVQNGIVPQTIWGHEECGHTDEARKEIKKLFENPPFDTPKPTRLIKRILQVSTRKDESSIVLDFFAGSGTTAQAVLDLNKIDNSNRQFICVQIPEQTDQKSEAYKAGYKVISDITKERIRRVIQKIEAEQQNAKGEEEAAHTGDLFEQMEDTAAKYEVKTPEDNKEEKTNLDLGFKVFKLSDSNLRAWLPQHQLNSIQQELDFHAQSPFSDQASNAGIRTEIMLNEGFPLHAHQEQKTMLNQNEVWEIYSEYVPYKLYICLDKHLQEATIAELGSYLNEKDLFICIDAAFGQDNSAKVALAEKCQLRTL